MKGKAFQPKPILFSTPMVLALLEGIKTMTRRIIVLKPDGCFPNPPYQVGEMVWVRETWRALAAYDERNTLAIQYFAGGEIREIEFTPDRYAKFRKYTFKNGWQSPYFMPREATRIYRTITKLNPELLCDISPEDARREGVSIENWTQRGGDGSDSSPFYREAFAELWDGLNAKRGYGWQTNPMVWAYTMKKEGT